MNDFPLLHRLITLFSTRKEKVLKETLPSEEIQEKSPDEKKIEEPAKSTLEINTSDLEATVASLETEFSSNEPSPSLFTFLKNPITLIVIFMITIVSVSGYYWYTLVFHAVHKTTIQSVALDQNIPTQNGSKKWEDRNFVHASYLTSASVEHPRVSIVVYDLGLNERLTDMAFSSLPEEVGLAFSPYSPSLSEELETADVFGFTSLVTIPLESGMTHYQDLGRLTLLTGSSEEENQKKLQTLLTHAYPHQILLLQGGDIFLTSTEDLWPIFSELKKKSYLLLSPPDCLMTQIHNLCHQTHLKYLPATKFLLPNQIPQLNILWQETLETAHELGYGIIVVPAMKITIDSINQWIKSLDTSKISLVSIEELFNQRD